MTPGARVVVSQLGEDPMRGGRRSRHRSSRSPRPIPPRWRPATCIIAIASASVGWVDLLMTSGQYQHMPKPPYTPGPRVRGRRGVGRRRGQRRSRSAIACSSIGFLAGSALARAPTRPTAASRPMRSRRARPCIPIPGELVVRSGVQPARQLRDRVSLPRHARPARSAGETVLIHGASGSTGLAAVHVAKLLGATVIATGRSDAKLAVVKAQGADHVSTRRPSSLPRRGQGAHRRPRRRRRLRRRRRRHLRSRACAACGSARAS